MQQTNLTKITTCEKNTHLWLVKSLSIVVSHVKSRWFLPQSMYIFDRHVEPTSAPKVMRRACGLQLGHGIKIGTFPTMGLTPKIMVCTGKFLENKWLRGTPHFRKPPYNYGWSKTRIPWFVLEWRGKKTLDQWTLGVIVLFYIYNLHATIVASPLKRGIGAGGQQPKMWGWFGEHDAVDSQPPFHGPVLWHVVSCFLKTLNSVYVAAYMAQYGSWKSWYCNYEFLLTDGRWW